MPRDRHHQRLLQEVEENRLEARGLNLLTARRKARRIAKAMVITAAEWRDEQRLIGRLSKAAHWAARPLLTRLHEAVVQPEPVLERHEMQPAPNLRRLDRTTSFVLGRGIRFLLGLALFAIFASWLDAKGIVTARQVRDQF